MITARIGLSILSKLRLEIHLVENHALMLVILLLLIGRIGLRCVVIMG